jgi:hypothetical protein
MLRGPRPRRRHAEYQLYFRTVRGASEAAMLTTSQVHSATGRDDGARDPEVQDSRLVAR